MYTPFSAVSAVESQSLIVLSSAGPEKVSVVAFFAD
jgi:hypothetical protein